MRINVYTQELTNEVKIIEKAGKEGETFSAVMFMLESSSRLHQPPEHTGDEDDRSAITFWIPKSSERRETLAQTFEKMAQLVREAKPETKPERGVIPGLVPFDDNGWIDDESQLKGISIPPIGTGEEGDIPQGKPIRGAGSPLIHWDDDAGFQKK